MMSMIMLLAVKCKCMIDAGTQSFLKSYRLAGTLCAFYFFSSPVSMKCVTAWSQSRVIHGSAWSYNYR